MRAYFQETAMPLTFRDLDPPATDEETYLWHTPRIIEWQRRVKARNERLATGPTARLRALAYRALSDQARFPEYKRTPQLSSAVKAVIIETGADFTTAIERDLVTGDVCAVVATLTKTATRGQAPDGSNAT
jgi:hypothetical protein